MKKEFVQELTTLLRDHKCEHLIMGDFNWDYNGPDNSLKRYFKQNDFLQVIEHPTQEVGAGILDHVYVI